MGKSFLLSLSYPILFVLLVLNCNCLEAQTDDGRKVHIVFMGDLPKGGVSTSSIHHGMLENVLGSGEAAKESLVYSYGRSFNGFAAKLSDDEVERFAEMEGVVSVMPNTIFELHTTRSWDFSGLNESTTKRFPQESDLVIGLLDTGIWPESESFNDEGFGPPPETWKGICQTGDNFTCNNKVIGARFYNSYNYYESEFKSPRDSEGHGSHTASTAAGRSVAGTSYYGLAEGVARGGVPQARIAVYKVCWSFGCYAADIFAGFDDAIADGVNIISVSLGSIFASDYFRDPIAVGSFYAMRNGILTSNSAGNTGPFRGVISNISPWTISVAASSIDRKFVSQVVLGNGKTFEGVSLNNFVLNGTEFPLIYGGDAPNISAGFSRGDSRWCLPETLDPYKVKGKIVFCDSIYDGLGTMQANGVGVIMSDDRFSDYTTHYPLPATLIQPEDGAKVLEYIKSSSNPSGTILTSEAVKDFAAPRVASFSSRGPNRITPDLLKPDITAPGVDILAAWSPVAPTGLHGLDTNPTNYYIVSGTSMSAPHVSGAAAYIKSAHPNWSPAAIKSSLMTTASIMDPRKHDDGEFSYGSGHMNPSKALDPGLVYDASEQDYINFLCNQGYNTTLLRYVTGDSSNCSGNSTGNSWDFNYPSFALTIPDGESIFGDFSRTVTNVGSPNSTYYATVSAPSSLNVTIEPSVLSFTSIGENKSFKVKVKGGVISQEPLISASIAWSDGFHVVRSPLVIYTVLASYTTMSVKEIPTGYTLTMKGIVGGN